MFLPKMIAATAGLALLALPVQAAGFVDAATGLRVDPPAPFVTAPAKSRSYDVAVSINSSTGAPAAGLGDSALCQVGYKAESESADLTQDDINREVSQPAWLDNAAAALSKTFDIIARQTFVLNGATGIELVGRPKDNAPGSGIFLSMIDTPAGRTTLNCATEPRDMAATLNQFRMIRAGIVPPGTTAP